MFRMWGKLVKNNRIIRDITIANGNYNLSRSQMLQQAFDEICYTFDLSKPIWLTSNMIEFRQRSRTRFGQNHFVEQVPFDYLEIQVIEE